LNLFEILLIFIVALVVLGPERLPEVIKLFAKVLRELRSASNEVMRELTEALDEPPPVKPKPAEPPAAEQHTPPAAQT
jgi:Tat protein translocase TatB subunit